MKAQEGQNKLWIPRKNPTKKAKKEQQYKERGKSIQDTLRNPKVEAIRDKQKASTKVGYITASQKPKKDKKPKK